jgi:hypothetical protein
MGEHWTLRINTGITLINQIPLWVGTLRTASRNKGIKPTLTQAVARL